MLIRILFELHPAKEQSDSTVRGHHTFLYLPAKDTLQSLFKLLCWMLQAVEDAVNAGIDRFSFDDRDNVKRSKRELRVTDSLAKEILDKTARKAFLQFVTRSRGQRDRLEAAKELKKMVFFSNIVVAALLEDVQVSHILREIRAVFEQAREAAA